MAVLIKQFINPPPPPITQLLILPHFPLHLRGCLSAQVWFHFVEWVVGVDCPDSLGEGTLPLVVHSGQPTVRIARQVPEADIRRVYGIYPETNHETDYPNTRVGVPELSVNGSN